MTLLSTLSQSLSHFQASIEGSSPYLSVYSYHSIVSLEEILAVVNQIVLSSSPRLLVPTRCVVVESDGDLFLISTLLLLIVSRSCPSSKISSIRTMTRCAI